MTVKLPYQIGKRLHEGDTMNKDLCSSENGIIAHSGGGQANAYQLQAVTNKVSTTAASLDSVALPFAQSGGTCLIDNDGTNPLAVYASPLANPFNNNAVDTLEDSATFLAVLAPGEDCTFTAPDNGLWYQQGTSNTDSQAFMTVSAAGTTQGGATPTYTNIVNVSVGVGNAGVLLNAGVNPQTVINATGNTIKIYPQTSAGTIDGGSAGAAVTLTSAHRLARFIQTGSDVWVSELGGAVST